MRPKMFEDPGSPDQDPFWPVLMLTLALIAWFSHELAENLEQRETLLTAYANQDDQVQDAARLRNSMDMLATGTFHLINGGNGNAKQLIDSLAQRGIRIEAPKEYEAVENPGKNPISENAGQ